MLEFVSDSMHCARKKDVFVVCKDSLALKDVLDLQPGISVQFLSVVLAH